jgi:hypothetical protein
MNSKVEIVREINKDYDVIKYLDLEVIRMKSNNFINASKLCAEISKKVNKKKELRFWLYNKQTIKLFNKILKTKNNQINKPDAENLTSENPDVKFLTSGKYSEIIICIKSSSSKLTEIRGTYLHLDLIPQLCNWISPEYAFKISYIINYINGFDNYDSCYDKLKDNNLKKIDNKIKKKVDKIKEKENEYQLLLKKKEEELENKNKELENKNKELENKNKELENKNKELENKNKELENKDKELEKLKENSEVNDIEIKKLSREIELLKEKLKNALDDNISLNDLIKQQNNNILNLTNIIMKNQEEIKEFRDKLENRDNQILEMLNKQDIMLNKLSKLEKDKEKTNLDIKTVKDKLDNVPEILLIAVSEDNNNLLYVSRINLKDENKIIKKLKNFKYKIISKIQTYNSVINYKNIINDCKDEGLLEYKKNNVILKDLSIDDFIKKIEKNIKINN